jgi:GntR family transcriptional regulator / MocR family aminotransferase
MPAGGALPRSNPMSLAGTTSDRGAGTAGPELLVELRRDGARPPLRTQLEDGLRAAVREGRLAAGARLPSTRTLARDLGVSRRLVVEAYAQLCAEGYLRSRRGSGTTVAEHVAGLPVRTSTAAPPTRPRYDFFPGAPDLAAFPRAAWLRATRDVLRTLPDHALGYEDPHGAPALREQLAAYLARVRGVASDRERIVIVSGAAQGLALLASVLARRGTPRVAVELPSLPAHRATLERHGAELVRIPVDEDGVQVERLAGSGAAAAVLTPAHQMPTGVALSVARRSALLAWDGLVVEDDYDAEFRYDRPPLGAIQGLAPERVLYLGSASKTLAPGLRLGWMVAPEGLVGELADAKLHADMGTDVLTQHTLARLIETGAYDRHLRLLRRHHRARRDALLAALARHVPGARVHGIAAGLHALVTLPHRIDVPAFEAACAHRSLRLYGTRPDTLVLGYANVPEPALEPAVALLAGALEESGAGA